MNGNRNQNILLVEIMIAVLFFALCSVVLLETFVAAREYESRSRVETEALITMQSIAEKTGAAENTEKCLEELGFQYADGLWKLDAGDCVFEMTVERQETSVGLLEKTSVRAIRDGKIIVELPGARYYAGGEA